MRFDCKVWTGLEELNHPELMRNYPMILVPSRAQWFEKGEPPWSHVKLHCRPDFLRCTMVWTRSEELNHPELMKNCPMILVDDFTWVWGSSIFRTLLEQQFDWRNLVKRMVYVSLGYFNPFEPAFTWDCEEAEPLPTSSLSTAAQPRPTLSAPLQATAGNYSCNNYSANVSCKCGTTIDDGSQMAQCETCGSWRWVGSYSNFSWVRGDSTISNLLGPLSSRGNKDHMILCHVFGMVQRHWTSSNHSAPE